jgi:hypothetical protein
MEIYKSISTAMKAISKEGIEKNQKNTQGYKFRGIDQVYNLLSRVLPDNNITIFPRVIDREVIERTSKNGTAMFYVCIEVEYDLVSSIDGSLHTIKTFGEAMDTSDKATNKAMSAAYKYALFETFCIPTEGQEDADAESPEVAPQAESETPEPIKTITTRQASALRKNLTKEGLSEDWFCQRVRIESVDALTADRYKGAMDYIKNLKSASNTEERGNAA